MHVPNGPRARGSAMPPQPATLQDVLRDRADQVREALDARLPVEEGPCARLHEAVRYMVLGGGKKLRPVLATLACEACGGAPVRAMPAACAVEMVHTYSLIHDDLPAMDDDALRHGQPSCHVRFDEATAILAGDALLTEAFGVIAREVADPSVARRLADELATAAGAAGMVGGQAADLKAEREGLADEALLTLIHQRKTAALLTASIVMGAISAEASEHLERSLRDYAGHLGLAFQIADDVLDASATTEALGKTAGKDAAQNKLTFVSLYGLEAARRRAWAEADRAIDALGAFGHEADWLRDMARFVVERGH